MKSLSAEGEEGEEEVEGAEEEAEGVVEVGDGEADHPQVQDPPLPGHPKASQATPSSNGVIIKEVLQTPK